jgi:hypothetical protein
MNGGVSDAGEWWTNAQAYPMTKTHKYATLQIGYVPNQA